MAFRPLPGRPRMVGYLRPRPVVRVSPGRRLVLGDLAEVAAPAAVRRTVLRLPCGRAPQLGERRVVSLLGLLLAASRAAQQVQWQAVGDRDVVVQVESRPARGRWLLAVPVWLLLFVGAATTLLDFHADVNMPAAHRQLYFLATGRRQERPLVIEVPYAIGLGLGTFLFFSVPGRSGSDPGPLELEVMGYEERLRQYWRHRRIRRRRSGRSAPSGSTGSR